jgi:hypothetical protein
MVPNATKGIAPVRPIGRSCPEDKVSPEATARCRFRAVRFGFRGILRAFPGTGIAQPTTSRESSSMNLKPVVLGLLAAACVTAAAGGAYLAVRQNAAAGTAAVAAPQPSAPAAQPVAETEALVTPPAAAAKPAAAEAPDPGATPARSSKPEPVRQAPAPVRAPSRARLTGSSEHQRQGVGLGAGCRSQLASAHS